MRAARMRGGCPGWRSGVRLVTHWLSAPWASLVFRDAPWRPGSSGGGGVFGGVHSPQALIALAMLSLADLCRPLPGW
jgi:hypothetical protein